jgi:acyl-CoA thioesterase FadM
MEYEVRSEGRRRATGRTVQVYVDPDTGESTAIPEHHRRRLRGG